jgi:hypothetical protein
MLSDRAQRFLAQWQRRPHVEDLGLVRDALQHRGVPITDPLLDFHRTFAGYTDNSIGDVFVFGLIHPEPVWLAPMEVSAFPADDSSGLWFVICADGHPSYDLRIDQNGVYYTTCVVPHASSFFLQVEQDAFGCEFASKHRGRTVPLWLWNDPDEMAEVLLSRLADQVVAEISDEYSRVYATDRIALFHKVRSKEFTAYVAEGNVPPELAGFELAKRNKSYAELQEDVKSKYSGRRQRAVRELLETSDPAAAPLFLSAVHDENQDTRILAIQGLGRVRSVEAVPALGQLIRQDQDEMVVSNAVTALKDIAGLASFPFLMEATNHRVTFVRRDAAIALGEIGDHSVLPALERLLGDDESHERTTGICPISRKRAVREYAQEAIAKISRRQRRRKR